jgi:hypothetical protein
MERVAIVRSITYFLYKIIEKTDLTNHDIESESDRN